jgi:poly-gamma-glutamate synthesis protein (capsule biosynthesis protein)
MMGRGVDQILPHPRHRRLKEPKVASSITYVELAEKKNGPIPNRVDFEYPWGDALGELERAIPDVRIINLETSVTDSRDFWPKAVNYAMSPQNVRALTAARIDCCALANNHAMDFGRAGLVETLDTLERAGLAVAGAGYDLTGAQAPAIKIVTPECRVLVFAFGSITSGIPPEWAAAPGKPGIRLLAELSSRTVDEVASAVWSVRKPGDVVVASIHWGSNWGYAIPPEETAFAHGLIEVAGVDVVHGHSSHHPKAIELHHGKLILYGCGDFIDDYEGIGGFREFRSDLTLTFLPTIDRSTGRLAQLVMIPFRLKKLRLNRASHDDALWLCTMFDREGKAFGTQFALTENETVKLV